MKNELQVIFRNATIVDELSEEHTESDFTVLISNRYQSDEDTINEAINWASSALGIDVTHYDYVDILTH